MKNLFLTGLDQIIDLNYVIAIEVVDEPTIDGSSSFSMLNYHLTTGYVVSVRHPNRESASTEKWMAYNQMAPGIRGK